MVGADLVVADRVEGYARSSDLIALIAGYGLEPVAPGQGNLVLRSVSEVWPFVDGERVAPALVVALDGERRCPHDSRRAGAPQACVPKGIRMNELPDFAGHADALWNVLLDLGGTVTSSSVFVGRR